MWQGQTERRPQPHTASAACADKIRAEERERLAAMLDRLGGTFGAEWRWDPDPDGVAAWMRAGGKENE